jgi:SAM-dependent methyltransferase
VNVVKESSRSHPGQQSGPRYNSAGAIMNPKQHWNTVYTEKAERDVSWFEALPAVSLKMLDAAGLTSESCVVDVGGGDSRLVDALMAKGLDCLAVLDVSAAALSRAKERLGRAASIVTWIEADVAADWSLKPMDIWHDRAVFHFLTEPADREKYVGHMRDVLKVGGSAIVATFDVSGPERCSGLPVQRYSADSLAREIGANFQLAESVDYLHHTPWGAAQAFRYSRFTRTS